MAFIKIILPWILMWLSLSAQAAPLPFKSKEDVRFVTKKELPLLDLLQVKEFQGVIDRPFEKAPDLKKIRVYRFTDTSKIKIDRELCVNQLATIFGPAKQNPLQVKDLTIYDTATGKTCQARMVDTINPKAETPERLAVLGFINLKPYALVIALSKKSTDEDLKNLREFWAGLR